ncbi:MAG: DUF503 domain-containing protein [Deltaproteobacteria bacterium]|nr:DUF503 domain-containing protein [Deltaproteobacteria bacterium]
MVIGVLRITVLIHESRSLKDKRQVLKSIVEKVKNRYNVSVAEVDGSDLWQRGEIGVAVVSNDRALVNSVMDKVLDFVEGLHLAEVSDHAIEIISV